MCALESHEHGLTHCKKSVSGTKEQEVVQGKRIASCRVKRANESLIIISATKHKLMGTGGMCVALARSAAAKCTASAWATSSKIIDHHWVPGELVSSLVDGWQLGSALM